MIVNYIFTLQQRESNYLSYIVNNIAAIKVTLCSNHACLDKAIRDEASIEPTEQATFCQSIVFLFP